MDRKNILQRLEELEENTLQFETIEEFEEFEEQKGECNYDKCCKPCGSTHTRAIMSTKKQERRNI